jgi:hypothetical protein
MRDFVPVVFVVQLVLAVLAYISGRSHHEVDAEGVDIFRISQIAGWFMTIGCLTIASFVAFDIVNAKPSPMNAPAVDWILELTTVFFGLIAIFYLTLRIRVDSQSVRISSYFGARTTYFRDLHSVTDKDGGRWRTLDVFDTRRKRILRVTSSVLPDYDELVNLLEDGMDDCKVKQSSG